MIVRVAESESDRAACLALRLAVFVEEQNVGIDEELDGRDGDAVHVLGLDGGNPVATLRLRIKGGTALIERVCVARARRGSGAGAALMDFAHRYLRAETGVSAAKLGAQTHALGFYERLGYVAMGDEFLDAGIPHYMMTRRL